MYHYFCEDCKWDWETNRRYNSCQKCGMTDIYFIEVEDNDQSRRLSDVK